MLHKFSVPPCYNRTTGMSIDTEWSRMTVEALALRVRGEMIPVTAKFSYFSTLPIAEEDLRQYLNDPIAAVSPAIVAGLPRIGIILAPYIEKGNGKVGDCVTFERPSESRHIPCSRASLEGLSVDRKSTRLNSSHLVISYAV